MPRKRSGTPKTKAAPPRVVRKPPSRFHDVEIPRHLTGVFAGVTLCADGAVEIRYRGPMVLTDCFDGYNNTARVGEAIGDTLTIRAEDDEEAHAEAEGELGTLQPGSTFHAWEDRACGGCVIAANLRAAGDEGAGCADHEPPEHINPVCKLPLNVCRRATAHTHCPECGSTAHTAADCDMDG